MPRPKEPYKESVLKVDKTKDRAQCTIKNEKIFHEHLYSDVRKRLKKSQKELPNRDIINIATDVCREIGNWVVDNPEGFRMPNDMGYLAISKFILIPFREDRFEIINKVKNLSPEVISERFREIVLKKYGAALTPYDIRNYLANGKIVLVPMWFNKRNCSIKKAPVFKWRKSAHIKNRLKKADKTNYYHLNFQDFFDYKVKALDTYSEQ